MRKQAERHAAAARALEAAGDVTPAAGPESSAAMRRAPRQPTQTGEALADALKKTIADLQSACDEGYRTLSAAGATNAYGMHGVALVGVRSALHDALAALEQAKQEPNAPAAELALAPEAWGGNALHLQAPACLPGGRRRKQPGSVKMGMAAAASGEGQTGVEDEMNIDMHEAEPYAKVYKEKGQRVQPEKQRMQQEKQRVQSEKRAAEAAAEPPSKRPAAAPSMAAAQKTALPPAAAGLSSAARTVACPGASPGASLGLAAAKPAGAVRIGTGT